MKNDEFTYGILSSFAFAGLALSFLVPVVMNNYDAILVEKGPTIQFIIGLVILAFGAAISVTTMVLSLKNRKKTTNS